MAYFRCIGGNGGSQPITKSVSYLKWKITKVRGTTPKDGTLQAAEFKLYQNGTLYSWNSNATVTSDMTPFSGYEASRLIDGNNATKFATSQWGNVQVNECNIVFSLGETITLDSKTTYTYVTGNDEVSRDPISWVLYGSEDGTNWEELDSQTDFTSVTGRLTETLANGFLTKINSGGIIKKKNLIISNDINASTLLEQVIDENFEVTNVFAGTYNSEANAYQTDLIKFFYDTIGTYGHQYYWHVIAKTDVTCDGTNYVAGDIIDYWYYNVKKTLLVEEA